MTEIFVEDDYFLSASEEETLTIEERIAQVSEAMTKAIRQPVSLYSEKIFIDTSYLASDFACFFINTTPEGCDCQSDKVVPWCAKKDCGRSQVRNFCDQRYGEKREGFARERGNIAFGIEKKLTDQSNTGEITEHNQGRDGHTFGFPRRGSRRENCYI